MVLGILLKISFLNFASITNIRNIAKFYTDLKIISGAEIDIVDKEGNLAFFDFDSKQSILDRLFSKIDLVIASYHQFDRKNVLVKHFCNTIA